MSKLLDILLEITLSDSDVKDIVNKGYIIAIKLKGERNFIKNVKPLSSSVKNGETYLSAEVLNPETNKVEKKEYKVSDINNINRSSTKKDLPTPEPKKAEPAPVEPEEEEIPLAEPIRKPSGKTKDFIIDLINNNRAAKIYYQGVMENKPLWRVILPVAYGKRTTKQGTHDYIRAWQWEGPSVRGVPKWKLFRKDRIIDWDMSTTEVIKRVPDSNYNPNGDAWMDVLYTNAIFENMKFDKKKRRKNLMEGLKLLIFEIIKS